MDMDMRHRLPGKRAVGLHEADASGMQHIADGARDLGDDPRHCCKCIRRHIQQGFKVRFRNYEAVSVVSWMNIHE